MELMQPIALQESQALKKALGEREGEAGRRVPSETSMVLLEDHRAMQDHAFL